MFTKQHFELLDPKAVYWVSNSVQDSNGWYLAVLRQYEAVIDVIGSLEGIDAFIY